MSELRLYVWSKFAPDWTDGLAVAIAESEEQARSMVVGEIGYSPGDWGPVDVIEIKPAAFAVRGGD